MSDILESIQPIYQGEKNQPILLYEGDIELSDDSDVSRGIGKIEFTWLPEIQVKLLFKSNPFQSEDISLKLIIPEISNVPMIAKVGIRTFPFSIGNIVLEQILNCELGNGSELSYIVFHLTNFVEYKGEHVGGSSKLWAKLTLESNDWRVTIETISKKIIDSLEDGGYAITHVGRLECIDNSNFTSEKAEEVLVGLNYFLSFVAGRWISPALPVGFNSTGKSVWEKWLHYRTGNYHYVTSWFPKLDPTNISVAFAGFMKWWSDEDWQESFKLLISWYVESNNSAVEQGIPMTQFAFELLSWFVLVEDRKVISAKKLNEMRAAERISLLFSSLQIPTTIPSSTETSSLCLDEISKMLMANRDLLDFVGCITTIRNRITHPQKKNNSKTILKYSPEERIEACRLSIWYLELCLLRLFDYEGVYSNRLHKLRWEGNYDKMPWANEDNTPTN